MSLLLATARKILRRLTCAPAIDAVKPGLRYEKFTTTSSTTDAQPDELFKYTSGRWIYNEPARLSERDLKFDVPALKEVVAASISAAGISSLQKVAEGGFNRILQATCTDGREVLARLPYPSTEPAHYTVASEVATLDYLRAHGLPVPRVYGWSSSASNPVGAEYILMEKLEGLTLSDVWLDLDIKQRRKLVEQVVLIEKKLFSLEFGASGSIYYPHDLSDEDRRRSVPLSVQGREFCIGPMAHYSWWHKERSSFSYDRGPCELDNNQKSVIGSDCPGHKSSDIFRAVGEKELQWTRRFAKPRLHYERLYREIYKCEKMPPQPHINTLEQYAQLAGHLGYPAASPYNRPVIRHPDLQPDNIILSQSLEVVGLIDWQHATIVPLCLAAGMPKHFQNYGDPESDRFASPARELPPDVDSLPQAEQRFLKDQHIKRLTHFFYAALTMKHNVEHFNAFINGGVIVHQRLYKFAGSPWEGDSVTLKAELIKAVREWEYVVSSGSEASQQPPISFSAEETEKIMNFYRKQQEMDAMVDQMRDTLGVDVNGWIPNERYASVKSLAQEIKARMFDAADPADKHDVERNFPFDDFDEDGLQI